MHCEWLKLHLNDQIEYLVVFTHLIFIHIVTTVKLEAVEYCSIFQVVATSQHRSFFMNTVSTVATTLILREKYPDS